VNREKVPTKKVKQEAYPARIDILAQMESAKKG
jgi:hypothetical protein